MGPDGRRLQVDDDERYARREARFERVAGLVLALLLLAGAAGFFANGPVSHRTITRDGVELRVQRYARNQGRTSLDVRVEPHRAGRGEVVVAISSRFLGAYDVDRVFPQPRAVRVVGEDVEYAFEVDGGDDSVLEATFQLRPERPGRQRGVVAVGDVALTFTQLVYP